MKEKELAQHVVAYLERGGWDVYQEVKPFGYGHIADIVARQGPVIWIVECKMQCSFEVMRQAEAWHYKVNQISVAVPVSKGMDYQAHVLGRLNLGLLAVRNDKSNETWERLERYHSEYESRVFEVQRPVFQRFKPYIDWDKILTPELKGYCDAGTSGYGGRLSPFRRTVENLIKMVRERPGITFKELFPGLRHHYSTPSTAKSALSAMIQKGVIKEIRLDMSGKQFRLYLKEEP